MKFGYKSVSKGTRCLQCIPIKFKVSPFKAVEKAPQHDNKLPPLPNIKVTDSIKAPVFQYFYKFVKPNFSVISLMYSKANEKKKKYGNKCSNSLANCC